MINKQNLWFITLFSLIMVLSIYYLTMSSDSLETLKIKNEEQVNNTEVSENVNETLVALRVADEEEMVLKIEELQNVLLSTSASLEEKNDAYEELQDINSKEASKEQIVKLIKDNYNLESFVSIDNSNIKITVASATHDTKLANDIIRSVQALFSEEKYITVKFE